MLELFPSKHVSVSESVFGLGALVLKHLGEEKTCDELLAIVRRLKGANQVPERITLDDMMLTVTFLFALGLVENKEGKIKYAAR